MTEDASQTYNRILAETKARIKSAMDAADDTVRAQLILTPAYKEIHRLKDENDRLRAERDELRARAKELVSMTVDMTKRAEAAEAALAEARQAKPVAWQYETVRSVTQMDWRTAVTLTNPSNQWMVRNVVPLYAHPPAAEAALADAREALEPFVAYADKVAGIYRKRGGDPDKFPDQHPFSDIPAIALPMGVWRAARAALARTAPAAPVEAEGELPQAEGPTL